jgi:hypothetical protein
LWNSFRRRLNRLLGRESSRAARARDEDPGEREARRIAAEQAAFKRLVIAFQDLDDMRRAVDLLAGSRDQPAIPASQDVIRASLVTSVVVGYGRCFTHVRGGSVPSGLPDRFHRTLSANLRALHDRLLLLRHTEFAHSDAAAAGVKTSTLPDFVGGALLPTSRRLRLYSLSDAEIEQLPSLLNELHVFLYDELVRLNKFLAPHGSF